MPAPLALLAHLLVFAQYRLILPSDLLDLLLDGRKSPCGSSVHFLLVLALSSTSCRCRAEGIFEVQDDAEIYGRIEGGVAAWQRSGETSELVVFCARGGGCRGCG